MIVCSCNVLSDRQIRDVMSERGPRMTSQVYGCLGCSAQCGRCARTIRRIMDQAMAACTGECACCPAAFAREVAGAHDHPHDHHHAHDAHHDHAPHSRSGHAQVVHSHAVHAPD
jgi:bacterioferritin-associated ferredoxin